MATVEDFRAANLTALKQRNAVMRDSINYFPPEASRACRIGFFSELGAPAMPWNQVELSPTRACVGQLFFKVPGGIAHGQHWLNVKFAEGLLRVPFRILTKDEDKLLSKNYSSIKKQVDQAPSPWRSGSCTSRRCGSPRPTSDRSAATASGRSCATSKRRCRRSSV